MALREDLMDAMQCKSIGASLLVGAVNGRLGAKPGGVATATVVARKRERGWDGNTIMWRPPRGHRDNDDAAVKRIGSRREVAQQVFRAGREGGAAAVRNTNGETMQRGRGNACARPFGFFNFQSQMI